LEYLRTKCIQKIALSIKRQNLPKMKNKMIIISSFLLVGGIAFFVYRKYKVKSSNKNEQAKLATKGRG
jgi:hypothetical protein